VSSSGSLLAHGPCLALCLTLSVCLHSAGAVDGAAPGDLYRLEDGVLVINWSPEVGFSLNPPGLEGDSSAAGEENASLGTLHGENVSSDVNSTSASLRVAESGAYSGGAGDAHLGWASWDPQTGGKGRHTEYGRRITDLVGVFSIEMEIKLRSNLSSCPWTTEWIPCP
jgi:hypothetical protein